MPRAAAVIIQDSQIALIERHRAGLHYFLFPGGKIEEGETPEEAVVREVREELGLIVTVGPQIARVTFGGADLDRREQFYFRVEVTGGEFGAGDGAEMSGQEPAKNGTYAAVWRPLSVLAALDVRPRAVADLVARSESGGWPTAPLRLEE